jgi:hypothetical protein
MLEWSEERESERDFMGTLILNSETANLSVEALLKQVAKAGGLTLRDEQGNIVAVIWGAADQEALTYAEAHLDLDQHQDQVRRALGRRDGITTAELLSKAAAAAERASQK